MAKTNDTPSDQPGKAAPGTAGGSDATAANEQIMATLQQMQTTAVSAGKRANDEYKQVRTTIDRMAADRQALDARLEALETAGHPTSTTGGAESGNEQIFAEMKKVAEQSAINISNALIDQYGLEDTRNQAQMAQSFAGVNEWATGEGIEVLSQDMIDNCSPQAKQLLKDMATPPTPQAVYHAIKTASQLADRQTTSETQTEAQRVAAAEKAAASATIINQGGGSAPVDKGAEGGFGSPEELASPASFSQSVQELEKQHGAEPFKQ